MDDSNITRLKKCRNCGRLMDSVAYMEHKICPNCHKPSSPTQYKDVHIVFNSAIEGNLRLSLYKKGCYERGIDFQVYNLRQPLIYGDISNVPQSTAKVLKHWYYTVEEAKQKREQIVNEIYKLPDDIHIRFWINSNMIDEVLSFYYCSDLFYRFKNMDLIYVYSGKDKKRKLTDFNIGELLDCGDKISLETLKAQQKMWQEIQSTNSGMRIMVNGQIKSVSNDYLDELVLSCCDSEFTHFDIIFRKSYQLAKKNLNFILPYELFEEVMIKLVEEGKLEAEKPYGWNEGDYMFMQNKFRIPCKTKGLA